MKLKTNLLPLLAYFVGSIIVFSQGHLISGTVVDVYGVPLPGVTVLEKDTSNGVVSDLNGNYVITASTASSTLVFSYLGFENQTVRIENRRNLDVILLENVETPDTTGPVLVKLTVPKPTRFFNVFARISEVILLFNYL